MGKATFAMNKIKYISKDFFGNAVKIQFKPLIVYLLIFTEAEATRSRKANTIHDACI